MRAFLVACAAAALGGCAMWSPSSDTLDEFRGIAASSTGVEAKDIKISGVYALIFTTHWTATTPKGVFSCYRDLSDEGCKPR